MLYSIIGFFSGILSGMGVGGGMLLIPLIRLVTDMSQQAAQSLNLFCFIPSAVCAIVVHIKNKKIDFKTALPTHITGIPFSVLGAYICTRLSSRMLGIFFGFFILVFGVGEIVGGFKSKSVKKRENSVKK